MENTKKHSLGYRAFILFLLKRIKFALFLFVLSGAAWYSERWIPSDYLDWGNFATTFLSLVGAAYFLLILIITYLEYRYYTYAFTEEAFIMSSGYIMRSEVAALYHQIQNVNIERRPLERLIGVSQVIIHMSGSERDTSHNKIVLVAIGKSKAKLVQKELLVRARKHVAHAHPDEPPTDK